jgi:exodeoxyribonuclease V gamma subunit
MAARLNPEPFFSGSLPEGGTEGGDIDLRDFLRFFRNPAQYLLATRLGMFFERRSGALEEREPFDVNGLDLFLLKDDIIRRILDNSIDESLYSLYRARGYLPHGTMGEYAFGKIKGDCEKFAETITGLTKGVSMTSLAIETAAGGRVIRGTIDNLWPGGVILYRPAQVSPSEKLKAWILRCLLLGVGEKREVIAAGTDAVYTFDEREPAPVLEPLIELYDRGRREPLLFLPKSSYAFAESMMKYRDVNRAREAARNAWEGSSYRRGDSEDAYMAKCFENTEIFTSEFIRIADAVYRPMLDAINRME